MLTCEHTYNFPADFTPKDETCENTVELRVVNDVFWIRLCAMGDLGFAEAYMFGDVECDDLVAVFKASMTYNRHTCSSLERSSSLKIARVSQRVTRECHIF